MTMNVQKTQFKIGSKNWLKHNMETVLIVFQKTKQNKNIVKLNFLQRLDVIAMKILCFKI